MATELEQLKSIAEPYSKTHTIDEDMDINLKEDHIGAEAIQVKVKPIEETSTDLDHVRVKFWVNGHEKEVLRDINTSDKSNIEEFTERIRVQCYDNSDNLTKGKVWIYATAMSRTVLSEMIFEEYGKGRGGE